MSKNSSLPGYQQAVGPAREQKVNPEEGSQRFEGELVCVKAVFSDV